MNNCVGVVMVAVFVAVSVYIMARILIMAGTIRWWVEELKEI